jgi:hypothetical protein
VGYPLTKNYLGYPFTIGKKGEERHIPMLSLNFSVDNTEFVGGFVGSLNDSEGEQKPHATKNDGGGIMDTAVQLLIPHKLDLGEVQDESVTNPRVPKYPQLKCTIIGETDIYLGKVVWIHNVVKGTSENTENDKSVKIKGFIVGYTHTIGNNFTTDLEINIIGDLGESNPKT